MSPPLVPQQQAAVQPNANLFGMLGSTNTTASPPPMGMGMGMGGMQPTRAQSYSGMQPQGSMFGSSVMTPAMTPSTAQSRSPPNYSAPAGGAAAKAATTTGAKSGGGFDDLWAMGLGSSASTAKSSSPAPGTQNKSIKDLAQEKAQAGIWGGAGQSKPPMGAGLGAFGVPNNAAPPSSSNGGGIDDLLF